MELFNHTLRELEDELLALLNGIVTNITFISLTTTFDRFDSNHTKYPVRMVIEMNINNKFVSISVGKDMTLKHAIDAMKRAGIKFNIDKAELAYQNEFYCY